MITRSQRLSSHCWAGCLFAGVALATPWVSSAGPVLLEETAKISSPDPEYSWPSSVAVDGDWLLAAGTRYESATNSTDTAAWLYQRQANGSWVLVRRLHQASTDNVVAGPIQTALKNGVAVITKAHHSWIYERAGTDWVAVPSPIETDGRDVEINGGTLIVTSGDCDWISNLYRKNASGAWTRVRQTPAERDPEELCEPNEYDTRGDVDIAPNGTTSIVSTYGRAASALIFEGPFGTTPTMTRLRHPSDAIYFGSPVAIENSHALVAGSDANYEAFTRQSNGSWNHSGTLPIPDAYDTFYPEQLELSGTLAITLQPQDRLHGRYTGSLGLFERNADGTYRYAGRLAASDGMAGDLFGLRGADISERRVAALGSNAVYVFDLPTTIEQRPTIQDTFEDGDARDWTPTPGSNFTVATTTSRVYRQSSLAGNAAALMNNTHGRNQAIEADLKPTAFSTAAGDKWFGLVTRYSDASNYYYVTLRNNNTLLLRKMANGVFTTLAQANVPITLNRSYRVRLEAIGTRLKAFVDDRLLAEASDDALDAGSAGVMMFRTQADIDHVLVSGNPRTTLLSYRFLSEDSGGEFADQTGIWNATENGEYGQIDTTGGARTVLGIATRDQVLRARMKRIDADGTNNWFGLHTRYRDEGNYYYVTLRNNSTVSLRKLVNGAIVELDSAPLAIAADTWYDVRFDAVGDQLRVYVNDVLRLEASDTSHPVGRYGALTYKTWALFDDLIAVEP
jgi:hypothetical protein